MFPGRFLSILLIGLKPHMKGEKRHAAQMTLLIIIISACNGLRINPFIWYFWFHKIYALFLTAPVIVVGKYDSIVNSQVKIYVTYQYCLNKTLIYCLSTVVLLYAFTNWAGRRVKLFIAAVWYWHDLLRGYRSKHVVNVCNMFLP